jgi:hypothetical protein
MDISVQSTQYQVEDRSWLLSTLGTTPGENPTVVLDISKFTQGTHFPNGYIPSGTVLGKVTATGLYGPYAGTTDEVQTVTEGGSGLTSFTLTLSGQTTGSIAAAATAAQVQSALEALSNVGAGNVLVTGSAGGPIHSHLPRCAGRHQRRADDRHPDRRHRHRHRRHHHGGRR